MVRYTQKQPHGGKRENAGRLPTTPTFKSQYSGLFKKKRNKGLSHKKKRSSKDRRHQMVKNKGKTKIIEKDETIKTLNEKYDTLQQKFDNLYNVCGRFLDHDDIEMMTKALSIYEDDVRLKHIQIKLLYHNIYKSRVPIKHCHENIVTNFKLLTMENDENIIKHALYSEYWMVNTIRYKFNHLAKLLVALLMIVVTPNDGLSFENDGTERNKKNFHGNLVEFGMERGLENKFKKIKKDNKLISLPSFIRNKKATSVGKLVFGYNENHGKDADATYHCIKDAVESIDKLYLETLLEAQNYKIIIESFGRENICCCPLKQRVRNTKEDRCATNIPLNKMLHDLFTKLEKELQCTRHDATNACVAKDRCHKKVRTELYPELNNQSSAVALLTFWIRKNKLSSLYVKQKSIHLLAYILKKYNNKVITKWIIDNIKCTVYCRGQRGLNLENNHDPFFNILPFVEGINEYLYDGKPLYSDPTTKAFDLLFHHKQIHMEMINGAMGYGNMLMPIIDMTSFYTLNEIGDQTLKIINDYTVKLESANVEYIMFGQVFGYTFLSYDDLSINKYIHSSIRLNLKLHCPSKYKLETDNIIIQCPINQILNGDEHENKLDELWLKEFGEECPKIQISTENAINLYRIPEAVNINKRLSLIFIVNIYCFDDDIKYDYNDDEDADYHFDVFNFEAARKQYKEKYVLRHDAFKYLHDEYKELEDENIESMTGYFNESGVIHHILSNYNYIDLYFNMKIGGCTFKTMLYYLVLICEWKELLKDTENVDATLHNDISEGLHGVSGYISTVKRTLSVENMENYVLFTKNQLVDILDYLESQYFEVYEMLMDITFNSPKFALSKCIKTGKKNKDAMFLQRIQYVANKLSTRTDHIAKKSLSQKLQQLKPVKANLNHNKKQKTQKQTKISRKINAEENEKKKKRQKEMNILKRTSRKYQKKSNKNKKKKKYKIKDCISMSGIDDVIQEMKDINYHKRNNKYHIDDNVMIIDSNNDNNNNNNQKNEEEADVEMIDNNKNNKLLKEIKIIDDFAISDLSDNELSDASDDV